MSLKPSSHKEPEHSPVFSRGANSKGLNQVTARWDAVIAVGSFHSSSLAGTPSCRHLPTYTNEKPVAVQALLLEHEYQSSG